MAVSIQELINQKDKIEQKKQETFDLDTSVGKLTVKKITKGLMAEIMATLAEMKISILSVNAKTSDTKNVTIHMGISIKDLAQFEFVATKIRRLKDVYAVERYTGGSQA